MGAHFFTNLGRVSRPPNEVRPKNAFQYHTISFQELTDTTQAHEHLTLSLQAAR